MGIYDQASKRVGSGLYLKLDAGKKRIRLIEHPYVSNKPGFKETDPIRTVFSWVVWNYEENRVQVLEQGPGVFKLIAAIIDEYGEDMPMECDLVITTTGAGLETKRTIVAVPKRGTMPPLGELQNSDTYPNLEKLTHGVPLAVFAKEGLPKEEEAGEPADSDTILDPDYDSTQPVNLDDIPFDGAPEGR